MNHEMKNDRINIVHIRLCSNQKEKEKKIKLRKGNE